MELWWWEGGSWFPWTEPMFPCVASRRFRRSYRRDQMKGVVWVINRGERRRMAGLDELVRRWLVDTKAGHCALVAWVQAVLAWILQSIFIGSTLGSNYPQQSFCDPFWLLFVYRYIYWAPSPCQALSASNKQRTRQTRPLPSTWFESSWWKQKTDK